MRTARLPESFFDAALVERVRPLVSQLTPLANEVIVCHLDAPGWCVLDLGGEKRSERASAKGLLTPTAPILVDAAPRLRDDAHGISGRVEGRAVFWEWTPLEGLSVYGRLSDADAWDDLLAVVSRIGSPLKKLFATAA